MAQHLIASLTYLNTITHVAVIIAEIFGYPDSSIGVSRVKYLSSDLFC